MSETSLSPRKRLDRIGRKAAGIFDHIVFIGENSQYGVDGARKAGLSQSQVRAFAGYAEAADHLRSLLGAGDLVLFKASRDAQLTRAFYGLIGEVPCTIGSCDRRKVCDDCEEFRNPGLVRQVNEQLTVRLR